MTSDTIGDLIIRLKNAALVGSTQVEAPYSRLRQSIADQLIKSGYLTKAVAKGKKEMKTLDMTLALIGWQVKLADVKRLSKPSRRLYYRADQIKPVRQGRGRLILSTSKGIMTGEEARVAGLGGEALFLIW